MGTAGCRRDRLDGRRAAFRRIHRGPSHDARASIQPRCTHRADGAGTRRRPGGTRTSAAVHLRLARLRRRLSRFLRGDRSFGRRRAGLDPVRPPHRDHLFGRPCRRRCAHDHRRRVPAGGFVRVREPAAHAGRRGAARCRRATDRRLRGRRVQATADRGGDRSGTAGEVRRKHYHRERLCGHPVRRPDGHLQPRLQWPPQHHLPAPVEHDRSVDGHQQFGRAERAAHALERQHDGHAARVHHHAVWPQSRRRRGVGVAGVREHQRQRIRLLVLRQPERIVPLSVGEQQLFQLGHHRRQPRDRPQHERAPYARAGSG